MSEKTDKLAGWRTIEGAPQMGVILLLVASDTERRVFVAEWYYDDGNRRSEWMITTGWCGWNKLDSGWKPVGWQPLPSPSMEGGAK